MKKLILSGIISLLFLGIIYSQDDTDSHILSGDLLTRLKNSGGYYGSVKISMDDGIEENYYKHLVYNKNHPSALGLRVRIYRGSGTNAYNEAIKSRANFVSKYEDIDAYLEFDTPDFVVYVGDCRTWSEALKLYDRIQEDYPFSYIVPQQPINTDYNKGIKGKNNE